MYFTFTLVLIFDISKSKPSYSNQKIYLFSGLLAFFYGGFLEFGQFAFTNSRSGDFFDFLFNTAGALLAILLWMILKKTK
jgi:VanZ family protein